MLRVKRVGHVGITVPDVPLAVTSVSPAFSVYCVCCCWFMSLHYCPVNDSRTGGN